MNEKIKVYKQSMGYMTRQEEYIIKVKFKKNGNIKVETENYIRRIDKDFNLPYYVGNYVDITVF